MKSFTLRWRLILPLLGLMPIGCGSGIEVDTTYGRSRGQSVNGTSAFAGILRGRGHEVRSAIRANEKLAGWADVIVRFSPLPGSVERREGNWLADWLKAKPGRQLIYIPRDFDAEFEFWQAILAAQPKGSDKKIIESIEAKRVHAKDWLKELPTRTNQPADLAAWYELEPKPGAPQVCKSLEGPWAEGVDAAAAAIARHEVFKVPGGEDVFLSGDDCPLAIGWTYANGSRVLAIANASFLLNATLLNHARRPLTLRAADWLGTKPRQVAFLEGVRLAPGDKSDSGQASQFHLLEVDPFNWIAIHFLIFLGILALSLATRLGRPIPEAASGAERPSAHPEALGAMLARTGRGDAARYLLESYRRWRHQSQLAGRSAATSHPPR